MTPDLESWALSKCMPTTAINYTSSSHSVRSRFPSHSPSAPCTRVYVYAGELVTYVNIPFVRMCRLYIYSRSFAEVSNIILYYHVTTFRGGPLGRRKKSDEKIESIKASHVLV